jgi:hypothetical protein
MHQRQAARLNATPIHFLRLDIGSRLAEATAGIFADRTHSLRTSDPDIFFTF